jgi:hypothetical protein
LFYDLTAKTASKCAVLRFKCKRQPLLPFWGEECLSALLLATVLQHCETATRGKLDSQAPKANADAMICCAEDGFIDLTGQAGGHLFAVVSARRLGALGTVTGRTGERARGTASVD